MGSVVEVVESSFLNNAASAGGGFWISGASVSMMLDTCAILFNTASGSSGGGLYAYASSVYSVSSTFFANVAIGHTFNMLHGSTCAARGGYVRE